MHKRLDPGWHLYVPFINSPSRVVSLKETVQPVAHQDVITKDNVRIEIDGTFYYRVVDPYKANYDVENYKQAITSLSTSVSRAEIGKVSLDEIFQHREELNERIRLSLNESSHEWGIECLNFEILKLEPPVEVQKALTEVAMAERTRRQQVIKSEADREYLERKSAAEMKAGVVVQTATLEATVVWNTEFRKGLNCLEEALEGTKDSDKLLKYLLNEQYLAKLDDILASKNVVVLPEDKGEGKSADNLLTLSYVLSALKDPTRLLDSRSSRQTARSKEEIERDQGSRSQTETVRRADQSKEMDFLASLQNSTPFISGN